VAAASRPRLISTGDDRCPWHDFGARCRRVATPSPRSSGLDAPEALETARVIPAICDGNLRLVASLPHPGVRCRMSLKIRQRHGASQLKRRPCPVGSRPATLVPRSASDTGRRSSECAASKKSEARVGAHRGVRVFL
jgi:hypothetical protein